MRKDLFFDLDLIKLHETNCLHHFVNPWVLCRPRGLLCYFFTNSRYTINTDSGQEVKNTPRWHFSEHVTRLFFLTILLEWKQGWGFIVFLFISVFYECDRDRSAACIHIGVPLYIVWVISFYKSVNIYIHKIFWFLF